MHMWQQFQNPLRYKKALRTSRILSLTFGVVDWLSDHNFFSIWPLKPFQNAAALTALLPGS